jgi:hypothetical protein
MHINSKAEALNVDRILGWGALPAIIFCTEGEQRASEEFAGCRQFATADCAGMLGERDHLAAGLAERRIERKRIIAGIAGDAGKMQEAENAEEEVVAVPTGAQAGMPRTDC